VKMKGLEVALKEAEQSTQSIEERVQKISSLLDGIKIPFRVFSKLGNGNVRKLAFDMQHIVSGWCWQWNITIDGIVFSKEDFIIELNEDKKLLERAEEILFGNDNLFYSGTRFGVQSFELLNSSIDA